MPIDPIIGGSLILGAGGLLGSGLTAGIQSAASDQAWKRQKKVLKNQIRWRVQDMERSGINPIAAVKGGFGGGAPGVAMSGVPDFGAALQGAASAGGKLAQDSSKLDPELAAIQAGIDQAQSDKNLKDKEATLKGIEAGIRKIEADAKQQLMDNELRRSQANAEQSEYMRDVAAYQAWLANKDQSIRDSEWYDRARTLGAYAHELAPALSLPGAFVGGLMGGRIGGGPRVPNPGRAGSQPAPPPRGGPGDPRPRGMDIFRSNPDDKFYPSRAEELKQRSRQYRRNRR